MFHKFLMGCLLLLFLHIALAPDNVRVKSNDLVYRGYESNGIVLTENSTIQWNLSSKEELQKEFAVIIVNCENTDPIVIKNKTQAAYKISEKGVYRIYLQNGTDSSAEIADITSAVLVSEDTDYPIVY